MSQPINSTHPAPTNFFQNLFVGSIAGVSAVSIIQPMIYFKNVTQAQAANNAQVVKFEKNPGAWYRGFFGFASSYAPTIALQMAANGVFENYCHPFMAAMGAGSFSAVIACPAELMMTQQQQTGETFWKTAAYVFKNHGIQGFYRAALETSIREAVFTGAYLGAAPVLKEKMRAYGMNEWVAQILAGCIAGTIAAAVSQPFDTFKTQKQSNFALKMSIKQGICQKTAFAGFKWRVRMIIIATIVMSLVKEKLNGQINNSRS